MSISHQAQALLLRMLGACIRVLRPRSRQRVGRTLGRAMMLARRRLEITTNNVDRAFPDQDREWKGAVVRGSYENLGITLAELLAIPSVNAQQLKQLVQITGLDEVAERASRKQSSILVSGHVANWEYVAMAAGLVVGAPITIVTHPQRNTIVDGLLNSYRSKFGNILVPMHDAARALLGTIRQGGVVAFLVDQHAVPERDPWIEFFGRATPTYSAPAALALRFGVPMYFGVADRHEDGTYHVHVRPVPMADLGNDQASIIELTTRHVRMLEHAIRRNPRLWSWQHRRWRDPKPPTTAHDENRHANTGKENP